LKGVTATRDNSDSNIALHEILSYSRPRGGGGRYQPHFFSCPDWWCWQSRWFEGGNQRGQQKPSRRQTSWQPASQSNHLQGEKYTAKGQGHLYKHSA